MTLDEELELLIKMRDYANSRIRAIRFTQKETQPKRDVVQGNNLWVQTDCITPHVEKHLRMGNTMEALAARAHVSHKTVKNIRDGLTQWTREDVSDSLMMAMGLPHIELPTVRIRPRIDARPPSQYYEE